MIQRIFVAEAVVVVITRDRGVTASTERRRIIPSLEEASPVEFQLSEGRKFPVRTQTWWISCK